MVAAATSVLKKKPPVGSLKNIMITYTSLHDYCLSVYGKKLYKLTVDGGFSCPNRDGTCGENGCIFCGADGSGAFAAHGNDITAQLQAAKDTRFLFIMNRQNSAGYFAKFVIDLIPVYDIILLYKHCMR